MSLPISISKTSEQLPLDPLLVVTRTAIGLGLGILMADKIKPSLRQAAAIALVAIGALAAAPWLVKITVGQINRSEWGSRARLRRIRGDSGYSALDIAAVITDVLPTPHTNSRNRTRTNAQIIFA